MINCKDCIASIDIGTQNIIILVGKKLVSNNKFQIIAKSVIPNKPTHMLRGEIRNLDIVQSIENALEEIRINYDLNIKSAYVGLSGQHIVCEKQRGYVFVKNPEGAVSERDLNELNDSMRNYKLEPGKEVISILPQTYILDGVELVNPLGMIGSKLEGEFNIIIGDQKQIELFDRVLKKCKLGISDIILSSIASSRSVLYEGEEEMGVMVVDLGAGTTDVAIYADNNLKYMGVIPIGSNMINRDIKSIGIMEKYIERLKKTHGSAFSANVDENTVVALPGVGRNNGKEVSLLDIANIIEARNVDIIHYLVDILNSTGMKNKILSGIVLTGGGANMKDIDLLYQKYFDCEIRVATPCEQVDEQYWDMIEDPIYATAVGLLLEGAESSRKCLVEEYIPTPEELENSELVLKEDNSTTKESSLELFEEEPEEQPAEQIIQEQEEIEEEKVEEEEVVSEPKEKKQSVFTSLGNKFMKFVNEIE